jgi:hypothetical protein
VASLPSWARLRAEQRALQLLGHDPEPLVRRIIILTACT